MKISKKKLQKIINEELEMAQNDAEMPYSGPKTGTKIDDLEGEMLKDQLCHIAQYAIAMASSCLLSGLSALMQCLSDSSKTTISFAEQ